MTANSTPIHDDGISGSGTTVTELVEVLVVAAAVVGERAVVVTADVNIGRRGSDDVDTSGCSLRDSGPAGDDPHAATARAKVTANATRQFLKPDIATT